MLNSNVVIVNQEKLAAIKNAIIKDGVGKLQVLSDFDKTLTRYFVNGAKIASLISILRDEHYLTPDYSDKANALYAKYHPIEIDPTVPLEEKQRLMQEWWSSHYELLVRSGLKIKDIEKIIESKKLELREGASEFFDLLNEKNIPLVILSAAGVGVDAIALYLKKSGKLYPNTHVASNTLLWDESGKFIGVKEPIVHSSNKNYSTVKRFPFYQEVKDRKNILFICDSVNDLQMLEGFDYHNVIKVGFLNDQIEEKLPEFRETFDVVILNDSSMSYLNNLLPEFKAFGEVFDVVVLNDGPLDYINALLKELVV